MQGHAGSTPPYGRGAIFSSGATLFPGFGLTSDNVAYESGSNHVYGTGTYTMTGGLTGAFADAKLGGSPLGFNIAADGSVMLQSEVATRSYFDGRFADLNLDLGAAGYVSAFGMDGADSLRAGTAVDVLLDGGADNDTLIGSAGDDLLRGGLGADVLVAGAGDDLLFIDGDDTIIDGGDGFDIAMVEGNAAITMDASGHGLEAIFSGGGDDVLSTSYVGLNNEGGYIEGGAGNDQITGGAGNDWLLAA